MPKSLPGRCTLLRSEPNTHVLIEEFKTVVDPNIIVLSFDVEWSADTVIDDTRALLDERGIAGTFFVTHDGVKVPGHERGIHPNFRRDGDLYRSLPKAGERSDAAVHEHIVSSALAFAPEAKGVRSHSLFFDSTLLPLYTRLGIEYDATLRLELQPELRAFWKQHGIVEIPTYYADYFDLASGTTGFDLANVGLQQPGMKVFDFHPNLVYTNATTLDAYNATRPFYHDPEQLLQARQSGRGTRTLFIELLDHIARHKLPCATMGEINRWWRSKPSGRA
jgi:hypothetical protein